jgi:hypothetical protein
MKKMISLTDIRDSLNSSYIVNKTYMEEKGEQMRIDISYSNDYILFQSDKKNAKYLECFNPSSKCVNRKADYIIITTKKDTIHCVIVELKKTDNPREQLILTEYFVEFLFNRILYKYGETSKNVVIRKIGAFKDNFPKGFKLSTKTKIYDSNGFAYIKGDTFYLGRYL